VLRSNSTISYADDLPAAYAEAELTPASEYHTVWDQAGAVWDRTTPGTPALLNNGGDMVRPDAEIYAEYEQSMRRLHKSYSMDEQQSILDLSAPDILAVLEA